MNASSQNDWNACLYDKKIGFVSELGKGVVDLLDPQPGEQILDVGCGTGDLSAEVKKRGAVPVGIDLSEKMIEQARSKYPSIRFEVANAETFRIESTFDAVFSNAALHWMRHPEQVAESIWLALRPGGRFVAEFGGKGNVETIIRGIGEVLAESYGINADERNPWYFPSVGEYGSLLEAQGFRVIYAVHFDRPTVLQDDEGMMDWLNMFADDFLQGFTERERTEAQKQIVARLRPILYQAGKWMADYKRIRVMAIKER
ncbi:methyltransferase domain-containing protein [Effusibacillus dendaii]|uniref:Methyltransferase type 11 n=1 Tax=Effusibacillus dendaii TaxID=2743772 RepID=A0A7I8D8I3_9BACL|nr:methyltransferase domain-containing protein [Effusibacillus dendaii]BCJ86317.1 methyltransferase type 11 [Effusibacillus dendaii]